MVEVNSYHQGDVMSLRERQGAIPACEPRLRLRNRFQVFSFISQGNQTAGPIVCVKNTWRKISEYPGKRSNTEVQSIDDLLALLPFSILWPISPRYIWKIKTHVTYSRIIIRSLLSKRLVKHLVDFGCDSREWWPACRQTRASPGFQRLLHVHGSLMSLDWSDHGFRRNSVQSRPLRKPARLTTNWLQNQEAGSTWVASILICQLIHKLGADLFWKRTTHKRGECCEVSSSSE